MPTNFLERNLSPEAQAAIDYVIKYTGTISDIFGFATLHPKYKRLRRIPKNIGDGASIAGGTLEFLRENPEGGVREAVGLGARKFIAYVMDEFSSDPGVSEELFRKITEHTGSKEVAESFLEHINLQNEMIITYEEFRDFFSTEWTEGKQ